MRDNGGTPTMRTLDINLQIEAMKHETKAQPISNLRTSIRYASPDAKLDDAKKLAKVIPAAAFRKTANGIQMTAYNGIIQIEVNHLANLMEVNRVKQEAEELSQTYLAFMGSSGHSVKIWVRFTRPDKSLPKNREEAEIFQAHAYRKAVSLYQPILSYSIELKNPALEQFCRQTYDPELYYNPDSTIMYMRQPMEMPSETTYQEAVQAETSPFKRLIPGYDSLETLSALFEVALNKACQSLSELQPGIYPRSDEDLKPLLVQLAENCFQAGIPEEETARWAIAHLYRQKKEFLIRQTVQSVYTIAKGFGKKSPLSAEQELELRTEEFMQRRYEFRYNTMTTVTEYRERNTFCFYFRPPEQPCSKQYRHERKAGRTQSLGQGCGPLSGLRPDSDFQSDRRFSLRTGCTLGRARPDSRTSSPGSLQQPTLGGLVLSLVSEYGGTLAADRPEICELHCTIARRSAGLPEVYFLPESTSSRITGILHGPH